MSCGQAQTSPLKEAYVDLGSGNTKLLVVSYQEGNKPPVLEMKRTAILFKKSMTPDKKFPAEIEKQGLETLTQYAEYAKKIGARMVGGGATSAFRQAAPQYAKELLTQWSQATGWKLQILSGAEEAQAGYYAILLMQPTLKTSGFIGFDMGGGSMQLMSEKFGKFVIYESEWGAVTCSRFLQKTFPESRPEVSQAIVALKKEFLKTSELESWLTKANQICKHSCCKV
jgi:exopolyphosphatase/guanosine-5'-triphosphate,3'-diphosphate pyrophosphatase